MNNIFTRIVNFALFVSFAFLLCACGEEEVSSRIVKAVEIDGDATYIRSSKKNIIDGEMELKSGDGIFTGENSRLTVLVDKDKYVYLMPETELYMNFTGDEQNGMTRFNLKKGEIANELRAELSAEAKYMVVTANASIDVRDATFSVEYTEGKTFISCIKGEVDISAAENSLTLVASEFAAVDGSRAEKTVSASSVTESTEEEASETVTVSEETTVSEITEMSPEETSSESDISEETSSETTEETVVTTYEETVTTAAPPVVTTAATTTRREPVTTTRAQRETTVTTTAAPRETTADTTTSPPKTSSETTEESSEEETVYQKPTANMTKPDKPLGSPAVTTAPPEEDSDY